MDTSRRTLLAGALAVAGMASGAVMADTAQAATNYGSNYLGDWSGLTASTSTPDTIRRAAVWMFGDSIAVRCQRDLATRLWAERTQVLAVDDHAGRPTAPSVDVLAQWAETYDLPAQVIMATGANDVFNPPVLAAQIDRAMSIIGGRAQVYWINVQVQRRSQPAAVQLADQRNTGWVNAQINEALARHENLHVVRWFEALAARPTRLTAYLDDGVHPNASGIAFRNVLTLQQVPQI